MRLGTRITAATCSLLFVASIATADVPPAPAWDRAADSFTTLDVTGSLLRSGTRGALDALAPRNGDGGGSPADPRAMPGGDSTDPGSASAVPAGVVSGTGSSALDRERILQVVSPKGDAAESTPEALLQRQASQREEQVNSGALPRHNDAEEGAPPAEGSARRVAPGVSFPTALSGTTARGRLPIAAGGTYSWALAPKPAPSKSPASPEAEAANEVKAPASRTATKSGLPGRPIEKGDRTAVATAASDEPAREGGKSSIEPRQAGESLGMDFPGPGLEPTRAKTAPGWTASAGAKLDLLSGGGDFVFRRDDKVAVAASEAASPDGSVLSLPKRSRAARLATSLRRISRMARNFARRLAGKPPVHAREGEADIASRYHEPTLLASIVPGLLREALGTEGDVADPAEIYGPPALCAIAMMFLLALIPMWRRTRARCVGGVRPLRPRA